MPYYTLTNTKTDESYEVHMSWDELQAHLKDNPHLKKEFSTPNIISGIDGIGRHSDDGWKDMLKTIKKGSGRGEKIKV